MESSAKDVGLTEHNAADVDLGQLALAVGEGDDDAFETLHRRLNPGLQRMFMKRTGGQADISEELAQAAWAEIWNSLRRGRFDPGRAAFTTYAYAIGYRCWVRHLERSRRSRQEVAIEVTHFADPGWDEDVLSEVLTHLQACLEPREDNQGLNDVDRYIVIAAARGVKERVLAEELDLAPSTINARKQAGLDKLRRCMAAKGHRDL